MSKARTGGVKARTSKDKVVSKASEVVNALLEPALQVANFLDGVGAFFPPCKVASNALSVSAISITWLACDLLEIDRRDSDVRIAVLFLDLVCLVSE